MLSFTQLSAKDVSVGDHVAIHNARKNSPTWKRVTAIFVDSPTPGMIKFRTQGQKVGDDLVLPADAKIGVRGR